MVMSESEGDMYSHLYTSDPIVWIKSRLHGTAQRQLEAVDSKVEKLMA